MTRRANNPFSFSGHETFPFRYGWLKKGVDAVDRSPDFFTKERAMVDLGVGKNMVASIRHWCQASQLIEDRADPSADVSSQPGTQLSSGVFSPKVIWVRRIHQLR